MKGKTIKYILGIVFTLALVLSLVVPAVVKAVDPFTLTITQPTTGTPTCTQPGNWVTVKYTLAANDGCDGPYDVEIEILDGATVIASKSESRAAGSFTTSLFIGSGTANGWYDVKVNAYDQECEESVVKTEADAVCVDDVLPTLTKTLTGTAGSNGWYTSDVTVTLTGSDAHSGVAKIEYKAWQGADPGGWTVYDPANKPVLNLDGTWNLRHQVTDKAGNVYELPQQTVNIDKTDPTLTKKFNGEDPTGGWYTSDVTVTLTGSDAISGVAKIEYKVGDAAWVTVNNDEDDEPFVVTFNVTSESVTTLQHKVTDNAGRVYTLAQQTVKIDKTNPTLVKEFTGEEYAEGVYWNSVTVTLTADDGEDGSGIAKIQYKKWLEGGVEPGWTDVADDEATFDLDAEGTWNLKHQVTDNAGRVYVLPQQEVEIIVDDDLPILDKLLNGKEPPVGEYWFQETVPVTLTASDPGNGAASGVAKIQYKVWLVGTEEPVNWETANNTEAEESFTIDFDITDDGKWTLQHKAVDNAGNEKVLDSQPVWIDKTPPIVAKTYHVAQDGATLEPECGNIFTQTVWVKLYATDAGSGVDFIEYSLAGGETMKVDGDTAWIEVTGECCRTLEYWAVDNLEQMSQEYSQQECLSLTGPTVPVLLSPANGATVTSSQVTLTWEPVVHKMPITYNITIKQKDTSVVIVQECGIEEPMVTLTLFNDNYEWFLSAKDCTESGRESVNTASWYFRVITDETAPSVAVNGPNGGESFAAGSAQTITWAATENLPGDIDISLYYSSNGGSNWSEIATEQENDGAYSWAVPDISSTQCLVKAEATDAANNSSFDTSNNVFSITQAAVAQTNVPLDAEWNFISLPLIPDDPDIDVVLTNISGSVESVWYYDAADPDPDPVNRWKSYDPNADPELTQELKKMEDGKGYWIDMAEEALLEIDGSELPPPGTLPPDYDVEVGWNAIGFKSTTAMAAKDYLDAMAGKYTRIYGYKDGAYFTIPSPYTGNMEPSLGYWVTFTEKGTIYP